MATRTVDLYTISDPTEQELKMSSSYGILADDLTHPVFYERMSKSDGTLFSAFLPTYEEMSSAAPLGYKVFKNQNDAFWFAMNIGTSQPPRFWYFAPNPSAGVSGSNVSLYCFLVPDGSDEKIAKFGTLKKMFSTYKQMSDAVLDARLADLPSGGVDTEAVNSAIDAKLETYTTERNTYVTNALANAGYATDAEVAQAVEEGTSGLATTESVTGAVDSAKTELRGEMPKPYDFVSNSDREDAGYLTAKNIYEDDIVTGMAASEMVGLTLRRPSATSNNTWGFLGVTKADLEDALGVESVVKVLNDTYEGKDLTVAFADEIAGYSNVWEWVHARVAAGDTSGILPGDYIPFSWKTYNQGSTYKARVGMFGCDAYASSPHWGFVVDTAFISVGSNTLSDYFASFYLPWNKTATNQGTQVYPNPYKASNLFTYETNVVSAQLPDALATRLVKPTGIVGARRYLASGVVDTATGSSNLHFDDGGGVFSLSESEVFGRPIYSSLKYDAHPCYQWPIFRNPKYRIARDSSSAKTAQPYWLRSTTDGTSNQVCRITSTGLPSTTNATTTKTYMRYAFLAG